MITTREIQAHDERCEVAKKRLQEQNIHGAWDAEPNRMEWEHQGLQCLLVRHEHSLHWCGYVGIPPSHPLFGKTYGEVGNLLDAHGEVNFSNECAGVVCHIPKEGDVDDLWWFGFDCGHTWDLSPTWLDSSVSDSLRRLLKDKTYRDTAFARAHVSSLAEQLAKISPQ